MGMDYALLREELDTDPLGRGYSSLSDQDAAASLNAPNRAAIRETFVSHRTLLARLDPAVAAGILDALEAAAASIPTVKWVMFSIKGETGIDLGHDNTRAQVDALVAGSVLSTEEGAALKALAERTVSRAAELGLPPVDPFHVQSARV